MVMPSQELTCGACTGDAIKHWSARRKPRVTLEELSEYSEIPLEKLQLWIDMSDRNLHQTLFNCKRAKR